jgi:hypothetical protein
MKTLNDVHYQFGTFVTSSTLQPYTQLVFSNLAAGHICRIMDLINTEAILQHERETLIANHKKFITGLFNSAATKQTQTGNVQLI